MTINFSAPLWSYLLGVIHGDGHVAPRSICVCVGYKDADYADVIFSMFKRLKLNPHVYRKRSALSIEVHSKILADEFRKWKHNGLWTIPSTISIRDYIAGVFDTDGCVSKPKLKHVSICLKRSGNLNKVLCLLEMMNLKGLKVSNSVSTYNGKPYLVEGIKIGSMERIILFESQVVLRNPRKAARMLAMISHIKQRKSIVPRWRQVASFCRTPKTWKQISHQFHLKKKQVDSVIQVIKSRVKMEVIPPPEALSKYRVSDQF